MTEISRQNHYHGEKGKALPLDDLRRKVEHVLADQSLSTGEFPPEDVEHLLNELLARQIELMDNLQTSEERFRAVAQTASEAIIIIDSQGKIIFWNNASESIFGYQKAEVIGKSLSFIMPERFHKDHKNGFERVVQTGKSHIIGSTVKMTAVRKDGVEIPIDLSLSSWKSNGEIFFSGIIRDTTERKSAEREIQSLARFPSENLNPVLRASTAGTILYANDASQPLLNLWESAVGQQLPDPLSELMAEVLSSAQSRTTEVDCDQRIYSLDLTPVVGADYVNLYGSDVTERYKAESQLKDQNQFVMNVFESLSYPFYVIDARDYTIKMANSAANAGELPRPDYCYSRIHNRETPCSGRGYLCPLEEVKNTRQPVVTEHVYFDGPGVSKTVEVHAYPIFDDRGEVSQMIEYALDITERKQLEEALQNRSHALGERVKELNCLYGISALVEKADITLEEILQGIVEIIPTAWRYPEITAARIILGEHEFKTENFFEDSLWQQTSEIKTHDQRNGAVQVCYLEERDASDEGPFLNEERSLINAIAGRLGWIVERIEAGEALQNAHNGLELRVQERTAELEVTNQLLQSEIVERKRAHEAEQHARQIAETLTAASQALTQTLNLDTVFISLLDYLHHLVPFDSANIALLGDEACLTVRAVRGYQSGTEAELILSQSYNIEQNPQIQAMLNTGQSMLISDIRQHPNWTTYLELEQVGNWLGVPLVAEDKVIGLCGLDKLEPGFFTQEHLSLAESLIGQATVAIQNAWLFEQVRAGRERLQSLSRRLVEVQESERRYISRELHDEAGQALTSLKVGLHLLERDADHPEAVISGLAELKHMADKILEDLHRLAVDLRPTSLDYLGLVPALRQYVESVSDKNELTVQFEALGFDERLPPDVEIAIYRIVQEAMTNVIRHSGATRTDVILEWRQDKLIIIVEDNGVGIDDASIMNSDRLGIVGMRERAEMLGGKCIVERTAGTGTTVLVEVPYGN